MSLHFAYGANMSRAVMRRHAAEARALGVARLADHRFVIRACGYASVEPAPAEHVLGVLWRITPRDRIMLDAWENIAAGLYRPATLGVRHDGGRKAALVYLARPDSGRLFKPTPKPGYIELIVAAAHEWQFPEPYIASLITWLSPRALGCDRKLGEFQ